jgi:hypothetical protein
MDRVSLGLDPGWRPTARAWGLVSGGAFVVATLLYLVEGLGLLGASPAYTSTSAGQLQDEAVFWVAFFAYRHATLWDYFLRDGLYAVAYLGLLPLVLAANRATGGQRVSVQVGAMFVVVGAVFGMLNAVAFFVSLDFWRNTGWEQVPPAIMDAVGRTADSFDRLSSWCGTASFVSLGLGLAYLGRACRTEPALPRWVGLVAYLGVVVLGGLIVLNVAQIDGTDGIWKLLALVVGVFVAPLFAIGLGLHLGRSPAGSTPDAPAE